MYASAAEGLQRSWWSGAGHIKETAQKQIHAQKGREKTMEITREPKLEEKQKIQIRLPEKVKQILDGLEAHGYEAYAVGGCIRDRLLGRTPTDWDITTSALPAQVKDLFPRTVDTGLVHGTVTVMIGKDGFEVTTYRIDGEYTDGRHPKEVIFTPSLLEDLQRRDFTINAMAYRERGGLVDAFDGAEDLAAGRIRCVGNPLDRFGEDALRILRAVRFAAQLDFQIEAQTQEAIRTLAADLRRISAERIQTELVKLAVSPHPEYMRKLYALGISKIILPEFDRMMETGQNHPHHSLSVGEHTIAAMQHTPPDKVLRLAMLFHDIAKPLCKTTDQDGTDHFHGHPAQSAAVAEKVLRRLKFDRATMDAVCALVYWHDYNPKLTRGKVRRAIVTCGKEQFPAIFAVKRADILAQSDYQRAEKLAYVEDYEKLYNAVIKEGDCISLKQLAVHGRDILALGICEGRQVGEILHMLLELVMEDPDKNEYGYLMQKARDYLQADVKPENSFVPPVETLGS